MSDKHLSAIQELQKGWLWQEGQQKHKSVANKTTQKVPRTNKKKNPFTEINEINPGAKGIRLVAKVDIFWYRWCLQV